MQKALREDFCDPSEEFGAPVEDVERLLCEELFVEVLGGLFWGHSPQVGLLGMTFGSMRAEVGGDLAGAGAEDVDVVRFEFGIQGKGELIDKGFGGGVGIEIGEGEQGSSGRDV